MQAEAVPNIETEARPRKKILLPLVAALALGAGGFASTFMGLWTPEALLSAGMPKTSEAIDKTTAFVSIPPIEVSLPGGRYRTLLLSATIETEKTAEEQITKLLPRIADIFNGFLADIDPAAFDKRGVLEIIKYELTARAAEALSGLPIADVLITEFRLK